ncbi:MAG: CBS domain-containing protein [Nanoarchaeota archaeon]
MGEILVSDIMTREPLTIKPETTVLECVKKMVRNKVGSLLLTDRKKLVGIISQRDVMWALLKKSREDLSKIKVIDISPKKIITIKPSAPIKEAIDKMKKTKFYRLPVIRNGELVGIVTLKDVLNFYPEVSQELKELEIIKEKAEKIDRIKRAKERTAIEDGICEECGGRDMLYRDKGMLVCSSCLSLV